MSARNAAPGRLEVVRALLNTWLIPNDIRVGVDRLADLAGDVAAWRDAVPGLPRPRTPADVAALARTRDALRAALGGPPGGLQELFDAHPVRVVVVPGGTELVATDPADPAAAAAAIVAGAVGDGTWPRLKACPDCRWVFYDHSRNRTKVWCGMVADDANGRSCGSIAKVQAYRRRQADSTKPVR
ncbi:MAG TPA: CGNR zinc finger domain-containing protein [Dactylosporangium sp.]|jgi:predicted RNA-binding Zn ribbon-like protein|nr:CGNR zinc finger domain-containing protein [Dactylosporangium sp.]